MWRPDQIGHFHVTPAQILKDWRVPISLLKRPSPLSAAIKAHAGACLRLSGAEKSRASVDPTKPLIAASVLLTS